MTDLSQYSDEEILAAAKPATDLSKYSDEEILKASGLHPDVNQKVEQYTTPSKVEAKTGVEIGNQPAYRTVPKDNYEFSFDPTTENEYQDSGRGIPMQTERSKQAQYNEIKDLNKIAAQDQLGGRVNLDRTLDSFGTSFDAGRSARLDDQIKKLQDKYPGADVRYARQKEGDRVFIKLPGDREFIPVEPYSVFDPNGSYAAVAGKVAGALANEENAATTATAIATQGRGTVARMAASGISGALGNYIKQGVEWLRGYNSGGLDNSEAATQGALSAGGEAVGSAIQGGTNLVRGSTSVAGRQVENANVIGAAERLALPGQDRAFVSPGQISPSYSRLENMFKGLFSKTKDKLASRDRAVYYNAQALQNEFDVPASEQLSDDALYQLADKLKAKVQAGIALNNPKAYAEKVGPEMQRSLEAYKDFSKKNLGAKYNQLMDNVPEGTHIDLSEVQNTAGEVLKPFKMQAKDLELDIPANEELGTEAGKMLVPQEESFGNKLSGSFQDMLKKVQNLQTEVADKGGLSSFEQIKKLRSEIAEYAFPVGPAQFSNKEQAIAANLYGKLTDAMENVNFPPGTSDEFIATWKALNMENKQFHDMMEQAHIKSALNSSQPEELASRLTPDNVTFIKDMSVAMPKDQFNTTVKDAFKTQLYEDPTKIESKLTQWKAKAPETLRLLMDENEEKTYQLLGRQIKKMNSARIHKLSESYGDAADRAMDIIKNGTKDELETYLDVAGPEFRKVLQYGVVSDLMNSSMREVEGKKLLNPDFLLRRLNQLDAEGKLDGTLFTPEAYQKLKDIRTYVGSYTDAADSGASLEAASLLANVTDVTNVVNNPSKYVRDLINLNTKAGMANFMMTDGFVNFLVGRAAAGGKILDPVKLPKTRAGVIAAVNFVQDINNEAEGLDSGPKPVLDITKHPNMTLDDAMALRSKFSIDQKAIDKLRQNQNMKNMERQLKPTVKLTPLSNQIPKSQSVFAALDEPSSTMVDINGNDISEEDRLRYMEEDAKDGYRKPKEPVRPTSGKKTMTADHTELKDMLAKMSKVIGVKESFLEKLAHAESSFGKNKQASTSSARGLMQFTGGTWKQMVKKYGKRAGISEDDIDDDNANALMGALYLNDNLKALKSHIGRKPTDAEAYATHFLGLEGAKKLVDNYKANPTADKVFPDAAKANPTIFYDKEKPRTVRQVYHILQAKVE